MLGRTDASECTFEALFKLLQKIIASQKKTNTSHLRRCGEHKLCDFKTPDLMSMCEYSNPGNVAHFFSIVSG